MPDFDTNVNASLLANRLKRDAEKAAAAAAQATPPGAIPAPIDPNVTQISIPVPSPAAEPTAQAAPKAEVAVPEPASKQPDESPKPEKEQPASDTSSPTAQVPVAEEEPKWNDGIPDAEITPTSTETDKTVQIDIKKIGSALNLEDIKSEQDVISKLTAQQKRLQELESLSLDGIPDELKKAVEVAKKGGDWLTYTRAASFDANALDAVELFEREYERANAHRFRNPDGSMNLEALDAEIDGIAEGVKIMEGSRIKDALVHRQKQEQAEILARTLEQQERFQKTLAEAANEIAKFLPKEKFGVALEAKHSAYFYKGIADGSLIKKHLGNLDLSVLPKLDAKKIIKTVALAELGENISEFRYKQGQVAGKKEVWLGAQNAVIHSPSYAPTPEPAEPAQVASHERLQSMKERAKPKNSL